MGAGWGEIDAQHHKKGNGLCEIVQHGLSPRTEQSSDAALPSDSGAVIQITFSYQINFFTPSEAALGLSTWGYQPGTGSRQGSGAWNAPARYCLASGRPVSTAVGRAARAVLPAIVSAFSPSTHRCHSHFVRLRKAAATAAPVTGNFLLPAAGFQSTAAAVRPDARQW